MDMSLFQGDIVESRRILYTPSSFAKANLIYLQETGSLISKKPHISKRQNLSSYLFFIVESGSGIVTYENKEYELTTGDCFFINCMKSYSHQSNHDLWALKWAHFNGSHMNGIYNKYIERCGRPVFHSNNIEQFSDILESLFNIASSNDYVRDMKVFESLTMLLTEILSQSWQRIDERAKIKSKLNLADLHEYLDNHYAEKILLDDLSEKFYINKYYLTRIFKKEFGISIMYYILQKRVSKAKQLLRFSDKTMESIGVEVGLSEPYYFSRIFKQFEGISPSEYRKRWFG